MSESPRPIAAVTDLTAYSPPPFRGPIELKLDANEGRAPSWFSAAVREYAEDSSSSHYPRRWDLEAKLADRLNQTPDRVLVTAGIDEALDRVCRAFLEPGRGLLVAEPTFEMIPRYVQMTGGRLHTVPWTGDEFPIEEMLAVDPSEVHLVVVVSPNNPTGGIASPQDVRRLAERYPQAVIVIDEAYAEYADEACGDHFRDDSRIVVMRTFSKAWGLAALRVGYVIGAREILDVLRATGSPFSIAAPSLALASRALDVGEDEMDRVVAQVRRERVTLAGRIRSLGGQPRASQANFVSARFKAAKWVRDALASLGIAVRWAPARPDDLRIGCPGDAANLERLLDALEVVTQPEALLLDMDGVLGDVSQSYRIAIAETAREFGVEVDDSDIEAVKAAGDANDDWQVTHRLITNGGVECTLQAVIDRFQARYEGTDGRPGLWRNETATVNAEELCDVAGGRPMAVVTGRPRREAQRFLDVNGLDSVIDEMVCREDGPLKPDPEPVRIALRRLGVRSAWMVGDTPDDLRSARAAGVVPIGFLIHVKETARKSLEEWGAARVTSDWREIGGLLRSCAIEERSER